MPASPAAHIDADAAAFRVRLRKTIAPDARSASPTARRIAQHWAAEHFGCDESAIRIAPDSRGKPEVQGRRGFHFNISHSGAAILVAASEDGPVGVDIENQARSVSHNALAERYFADADRARYLAAPKPCRRTIFLRLWVAKEAALKCAGSGLAGQIERTTCEFAADRIVAVRAGGIRYAVAEFEPFEGYIGAVACPAQTVQIDSCKNVASLAPTG